MPFFKIVSVFLILTLSDTSFSGNQEKGWSRELSGYHIGYTEHRTNLPGGRHANIATSRACIIKADGSGRRVLAEELCKKPGSFTQFAGWSPDGSKAIILSGYNPPENAAWEEKHKTFRHGQWLMDTCLVDMANGKVINLTAIERVSNYNSGLFFWPGDPRKLGFQAIIDGVSVPFSMDLDGRNKKNLSKGTAGFTYGFAASPNGKRIAYHKSYQVFLANGDGTDPRQVKTGKPFNFVPQWSPDGSRLLFLAGEHYDCHPHTVKADGTGLKKLASRQGYTGVMQFLDVPDFHGGSSDVPAWSADGAWIHYTAKVGPSIELMRVNLAGKIEQLTTSKSPAINYHPRPSPDGKWIVFGSTRSEGRRQLFVMPAAGGKIHQVTNVPAGWAAMHAWWRPAAKSARP
jgi:Tol biopolymer transport system component